MRQGRPLRFLAMVLGGWTAIRIVALWPVAETAAAEQAGTSAIGSLDRRAAAPVVPQPLGAAPRPARPALAVQLLTADRAAASARPTARAGDHPPPPDPLRYQEKMRMIAASPAAHAGPPPGPAPAPQADVSAAAVIAPLPTRRPAPSRLHGDLWAVARPGGGAALAFGQLGAAQAGLRLTYALDETRRVALSGRVATPLRGRGREGAAGLDWRPLPLPVHLLVEARVPLDGGPARPAAQLIGGGLVRVPLGLQLEGYAQAGAVRARGTFADGSARITRRLVRDRAALDLGAGVWGAAQRGLARLDIGPTAGATLPLGAAAVRLGLDYRVRIAGRARPGSGPAVSLGSSF